MGAGDDRRQHGVPRQAGGPRQIEQNLLHESGVTRMKRFRDLALVAAIAGLAAYQGRQLSTYAATTQAPTAATQNAGPTHGGNTGPTATPAMVEAGAAAFQQNCA